MSEHFFRRWSRRKHEVQERDRQAVSPVPAAQDGLPTLQDVARLARDGDFSRFLAPGLDPRIRRAALKKLFSDPHFNRMDGLDVYIGDYTRAEPLTEAMRATLAHVGDFLKTRDEDGEDPPLATTAPASAEAPPDPP